MITCLNKDHQTITTNSLIQAIAMSNAQREVVTFGLIMLDLIKTSDFQKSGTKTAQLRQSVTKVSYYASKQANDNLTESFYSNSDFGYGEQPFTSKEERVVFMNIPVVETEEGLKAKLANAPKARIYKILSHFPILTSAQENAISRGLKTRNEFANKQCIKYGEGTVINGVDVSGQLILFNGKPQFKVTKFSVSGKADEDLRPSETGFYSTPEIETMMTGEVVIEDAEYSELTTGQSEEAIGNQVM